MEPPTRRDFALRVAFLLGGAAVPKFVFSEQSKASIDVAAIDRARILSAAKRYLTEVPITIAASSSPRSPAGKHDYFSEGDYWWPDPKNPNGPYVRRDGMSNPENFTGHRHALIRLSIQVPALAAAWLLTRDERYASHALKHLRAWFLDESTLMNPNLEHAQAVKGRDTGRSIGIIDTVHLVEVARAITVLGGSKALSSGEAEGLKSWVARYLSWLTTSPCGQEERDAKNNHGTCWVMQAAEFARYTENRELTEYCRDRFKTVLVPNQIAANGSFPLELQRTKPYGYSLFSLDAMAIVCQILSGSNENLWTYETSDGRGMKRAMAYMFPFIANKKSWPYPPDFEFFEHWPVRQPSLLFAGVAFALPDYLALWRTLNPTPTVEEIIRNYPLRQPVLWLPGSHRISSK
jgi:hypothetical protein